MQDFSKSALCQTTYSIISTIECVEGVEVVQYGMEQCYFDANGDITITKIPSISDEKDIIIRLLEGLANEDVAPCSLQDIVEDYVTECFMV